MKPTFHSSIASGLVFAALALGVVASPVRAVAQHTLLAKAEIPFAFQVGSTVMPAGNYTISAESSHMLLLRDSKARAAAFTTTVADTDARPAKRGTIVFTKYGDRYFLHRITVPNSTSAYKCTPGKQETELISKLKLQNATQVAVNAEPGMHP